MFWRGSITCKIPCLYGISRISIAIAVKVEKDVLMRVVFGSDECHGMSRTVPELQPIAIAVIGYNEEDGAARWLAMS